MKRLVKAARLLTAFGCAPHPRTLAPSHPRTLAPSNPPNSGVGLLTGIKSEHVFGCHHRRWHNPRITMRSRLEGIVDWNERLPRADWRGDALARGCGVSERQHLP